MQHSLLRQWKLRRRRYQQLPWQQQLLLLLLALLVLDRRQQMLAFGWCPSHHPSPQGQHAPLLLLLLPPLRQAGWLLALLH
jgi:hypothetical protein